MPPPTLKKRPDGRYRVKYKGKCLYGSTQSEAYAARDEYKLALARSAKIEQEGLSVRAYAATWISTYKAQVSANTYNSYVRILDRFCDEYGDCRIADITPKDIQIFLNKYSCMSQSSITKYTITIKSMFRSAAGDRVTAFDPAYNITALKGSKGSHRALIREERDLIQRTEHRIRTGVFAMLYAGLRRGEAMAIDIDRDVDFDTGLIHVREAVRFDGNTPVICDPKTEAGKRSIPLLDILADELRGKHGLLMPDADGNIMSETAFTRAWSSYITALETELNGCHKRWYGKTREHKAIAANNGIIPAWKHVNIRPHDLRHTFCTILYENNVDIKTAMKWMGHADHNMIMKIYAHLTEEREKYAYKSFVVGVNKTIGGQNGGQDEK